MKNIKLIDALPGAGKTRAEVAHIINSTHNRFLYTCKGKLQIDSLANDFNETDIVFKSFYSDDTGFTSSIVEDIEKYVTSISQSDTRKHVVAITHNAFDRFRSIQFFNDANFHQSYDELNDAVLDFSVKWDTHSNPEAFYATNEDGDLVLNNYANMMVASSYKFRAQSNEVQQLINLIRHPRYAVRSVTSKEMKEQDAYVEYYQARIRNNYFLDNVRMLSYGILGSITHQYITSHLTDYEITTQTLDYDPRGTRITVIPFTQSANSSYLQTDSTHKITYEKMMHRMFEEASKLVKETNGSAMSYTNKRHESIAQYYEDSGIVHLPIYLHGLQNYKHCNVLVTTFVANRSPESILGLTQLLDVSKEDALRERSNHALIQATNRGVTRDYSKSNEHMFVLCVSLDDAEHIKSVLPNVDIDMRIIEEGEFTFKSVRKVALNQADRDMIRHIKKRFNADPTLFPLHVRMILNDFCNLKGGQYKEALTKAGIWDNFSSRGVWKC